MPTLRLRERLQAAPGWESTAADRPSGWAALARALSLSPRSESRLLAAFVASISRMSARRDVLEAGRNASDFGVEAMATNDLSAYKPVVERLEIERQIRVAHVKNRV